MSKKQEIMSNTDMIEQDKITINEKLVVADTETQYITRIPYTREFISFDKDNCEWVNKKTMKVTVKDENEIGKMKETTVNVNGNNEKHYTLESVYLGKDLKKHYDEVLKKNEKSKKLNGDMKKSEDTELKVPGNDSKTVEEYQKSLRNRVMPHTARADDEVADMVVLTCEILDFAIRKAIQEGKDISNRLLTNKDVEVLEKTIQNNVDEKGKCTIEPNDIIDYVSGENKGKLLKIFDNVEVSQDLKNKVKEEVNTYDKFEQHTYLDDNVLKYYPVQMRNDDYFQKLLTYQCAQEVFLNDYTDRGNDEKVRECNQNVKAAKSIIMDKIEIFVNEKSEDLKEPSRQEFLNAFENVNPEDFKKYPAELQQEQPFRELVCYKSTLECYKKELLQVIEDNVNTLRDVKENEVDIVSEIFLLDELDDIEEIIFDKLEDIEDQISEIDFVLDHKVSLYKEVESSAILLGKDVIEKYKGQNLNQSGIKEVDVDNVNKISAVRNGHIHMYQNKDDNTCFLGKEKNGKVKQLTENLSLKEAKKQLKQCVNKANTFSLENINSLKENTVQPKKKAEVLELTELYIS